jgi:hypothetical protein
MNGAGGIATRYVLCRTISRRELTDAGTMIHGVGATKNSNLHEVIAIGRDIPADHPFIRIGWHVLHVQSTREPLDFTDDDCPFGFVEEQFILAGWQP